MNLFCQHEIRYMLEHRFRDCPGHMIYDVQDVIYVSSVRKEKHPFLIEPTSISGETQVTVHTWRNE